MIPRVLVFVALLFPMASGLAQETAPDPARILGSIVFRGKAPEPEQFEPDGEMLKICGHDKNHVQKSWLIGEWGGLANCVVTLRPKGGASPLPLRPTEGASYRKKGCAYEPRVLVVTKGTELLLRNENAPCNGFHFVYLEKPDTYLFKLLLIAGAEERKKLSEPGIFQVRCDSRSSMVGFVAVVDTPYFALSDAQGSFEVKNVLPGPYTVTVWHEKAGTLSPQAGPMEIDLRPGETRKLEYTVKGEKKE